MSIREDAIKKLASAADDWGWKGGKPGEITGSEVRAKEDAFNWLSERDPVRYRMYPIRKQPEYADYYRALKAFEEQLDPSVGLFTEEAYQLFHYLEKAGVPREWTGKLARVYRPSVGALNSKYTAGVSNKSYWYDDWANEVSSLMRPMNNDQRQTFITLLPKWTGTLEQAASTAKRVMGTQTSRRPRPD